MALASFDGTNDTLFAARKKPAKPYVPKGKPGRPRKPATTYSLDPFNENLLRVTTSAAIDVKRQLLATRDDGQLPTGWNNERLIFEAWSITESACRNARPMPTAKATTYVAASIHHWLPKLIARDTTKPQCVPLTVKAEQTPATQRQQPVPRLAHRPVTRLPLGKRATVACWVMPPESEWRSSERFGLLPKAA